MIKLLKIINQKFLISRVAKILFCLLLVVSAGVRFYRPMALTIFLDDQGRDVFIAAQIIKDGKIPFIGPMASIGSLYLGPIFYWAIAPFLLLSGFSPVGPIFLMAFLGLAANVILFFFMAKYFNLRAAFIGAWLYALSPLVVINARFIWNPNPVPFFTLIFLWFLVDFLKKGKFWSLFWVGVSLGILIQLHYVTGILFIIAFGSYLVWLVKNRKTDPVKLIKPGLFLLLGIIIPLVPFILFEIKNHFINTKAGWQFIFKGSSSNPRLLFPGEALLGLVDRFSNEALVVGWSLIYFLVNLTVFFIMFFFSKNRQESKLPIFLVLVIFIVTLLASVLVIRGQVHLHYIGLLLPLFFIIIGAADYFWKKITIGWFSFSWLNFLVLGLIFLAMIKSNYKLLIDQDDNQQINRAKAVAQYIADQSKDKNIFVTSLTGSPNAYVYRYYLYLAGFTTDSLNPSSVFAICDGGECDNAEGHALWEIAQFGILKTVSAEHAGHGTWVHHLKSPKKE